MPSIWKYILKQQWAQEERLLRLEKRMSNIDDAVKATQDAESALEARVMAHETNDAAVAAALQKQIDDLKANGADANAIANLQALVDHMNTFDADNPEPPPTG